MSGNVCDRQKLLSVLLQSGQVIPDLLSEDVLLRCVLACTTAGGFCLVQQMC